MVAAAMAAAAAGLEASERKLESMFPETWEETWCVPNCMCPNNDHVKNNELVKHDFQKRPK